MNTRVGYLKSFVSSVLWRKRFCGIQCRFLCTRAKESSALSLELTVWHPSVCQQFTFSFSFYSQEFLDRFSWNLVWIRYLWSFTSVVFRQDPFRSGSQVGKSRSQGAPPLTNIFVQHRMKSNDLEASSKKCCLFLFHKFQSQIFTRFDVFIGLTLVWTF